MTTLRSGDAGYTPPAATGPIRSGRGTYRLVAILTAIMMVVGGFALTIPVASADAGASTQTTDDLNLRAGPTLNADILTVIPAGEGVGINGDPENGFYPVSWNGHDGYAYGAYLTGQSVEAGPVTIDGQQGEVNVVDGPVNFRSGPSLADSVISVIPDGGLVALTGDSANGFVSIIYTDRAGWAHAPSVFGTGEGETAAPEESAEPETPATETPAEAETPDTGEAEAPEETGDAATPESVPVGDAVTGAGTVVDGGLNLRTGPGLEFTVVTVMPDGSSVELRGEPQNGFYPVSLDGATGWASADFLSLGDEATEPATEEPAAPADEAETPTEEATEPVEEATEPVAEETETPTDVATEVPTEEPTEVATEAPADEPAVDGSDGYTEDELIQVIYEAADRYGQPREDMLRVARCESVLDPGAVNASSDASGLFQFLPSTWETTPYADQDVFDPVANANAAAWMWSEGRRNEWTCQ